MGKIDDPEHKAQLARDRILEADLFEKDKEAMVEFLDAIHPDVATEVFVNGNGDRERKSYATVAAYGQGLKRFGEFADKPLMEMDATEANTLFKSLESGEHPDVKDSGYTKSTLSQWQSAVTKFYEYHSELGVDPAEIVVRAQPKTSVDDRDMYTREEVEELRDAVTNTRDRCILELLLNTGQRIRAIQTLRIKDVKPEEGIYYLNTDVSGLKGAEKTGTKRPLLGAQRAVYDWLQNHPTGERDDYLITTLPSANRGTPGDILSQDNIRTRLKILADRADLDKPPNPHNFRHYFVTMCKRDYDMDETTIKYLIGHGPGSKVMETTYQHLSDEDHIKAAEVATGRREEEDNSPLTPKVCPTCKEQQEPNAKACPSCGTVFAPDAKAAQERIDEQISEQKEQADNLEEYKDADKIAQAIDDDPKLAAQLMDKLGELSDE